MWCIAGLAHEQLETLEHDSGVALLPPQAPNRHLSGQSRARLLGGACMSRSQAQLELLPRAEDRVSPCRHRDDAGKEFFPAHDVLEVEERALDALGGFQ